MEVSVLETEYPPTEMFFLICKSWAWAASVVDSSSATIQERRRKVRVGMDSTPRKDVRIRTLQASTANCQASRTYLTGAWPPTPAECLPNLKGARNREI